MMPRIAPTDEFVDLMCDLAEGRISPPQFDRLDELLCADPANCQNYVDFMAIVTRLAWIGDDGDRRGGADDRRAVAGSLGAVGSGSRARTSRPAIFGPAAGIEPSPAMPAPFPILLSTTLHGPAGFFSSEWLVSYSIATVITAIGLLIVAVMRVSDVAQPTRVAGPSRSIESSNPQSLIPNPSPFAVAKMSSSAGSPAWSIAGGPVRTMPPRIASSPSATSSPWLPASWKSPTTRGPRSSCRGR